MAKWVRVKQAMSKMGGPGWAERERGWKKGKCGKRGEEKLGK